MANIKISETPTASAITGAELLPVVQGGVNKKVTVDTTILNRHIVQLINGELTADGGAISNTTYTDLDDVNLPSPVGIAGAAVYLTQIGLHGSIWISDDTDWQLMQSRCVLDMFADNKYVVFPETAFTTGTPTSYNAGVNTKLTMSAVAHGLTNGNAQNSYIYISAGTNWVIGLHKVLDVSISTDSIIIETAFDAGFGNATISPKNTKTPYRVIGIPKLRSNSAIKMDFAVNGGGAVGVKSYSVELGGTAFWVPASTTQTSMASNNVTIQNVNSTSVQVGSMKLLNVPQTGTDTAAPVAGAIDTSVGTNLILYVQNASANEKVGFTRGIVELIQ